MTDVEVEKKKKKKTKKMEEDGSEKKKKKKKTKKVEEEAVVEEEPAKKKKKKKTEVADDKATKKAKEEEEEPEKEEPEKEKEQVEKPTKKKKTKTALEEEKPKKKKKKSPVEEEEEEKPKHVEEEKPKKKKRKSEEEKALSKKKKKKTDEEEEPAEKDEPAEKEEEKEEVKKEEVKDEGGVKKIFVNNLVWSVDEGMMKEHFGDGIVGIEWIEDKETKRFKGMAVVEFETAALAKKAVETKHETDFAGRTMYCRLDETRERGTPRQVKPKPEGCKKLYCGNLSYDIDDAAMKDFFDSCGVVEDIKWVSDKVTGDFKGCGFVEFQDTTQADKAILLQGSTLLGRTIRLDWAEEKQRSPRAW